MVEYDAILLLFSFILFKYKSQNKKPNCKMNKTINLFIGFWFYSVRVNLLVTIR